MNKETLTLLIYVIVQGLFAFGIWNLAIYIHPIEQQIEINDCNQRLEDCQWYLLERNAEIETLTKRIELDSLINSK